MEYQLLFIHKINAQLQLDLNKHNDQYPPIEARTYKSSHDRFLIIDNTEVYHIGASLKDLGKKSLSRNNLLFGLMQRMDLVEKSGSGFGEKRWLVRTECR